MSAADENRARYFAALHEMQSGVAAKMSYDGHETEPKHLRVGVNSAHVSNAALVRLLIEKGVFTLDEYEAVLADEAEREVARYAALLSTHYGKPVKLG